MESKAEPYLPHPDEVEVCKDGVSWSVTMGSWGSLPDDVAAMVAPPIVVSAHCVVETGRPAPKSPAQHRVKRTGTRAQSGGLRKTGVRRQRNRLK